MCLTTLETFELALYPSASMRDAALALAINTGRTVYDSLYVALAESRGCSLVTSDERLVNGLKQTRPTASVLWLGSF
jgi:predicted nucleic acid-binding protein